MACGRCEKPAKIHKAPPLRKGGKAFYYMTHHLGGCEEQCTGCNWRGTPEKQARDTSHLETFQNAQDERMINFRNYKQVHVPDCKKGWFKNHAMIALVPDKPGPPECSEWNQHRMCVGKDCKVFRQAMDDLASVPPRKNPFHHPVVPLRGYKEQVPRVLQELNPRMRRKDMVRNVWTYGEVMFRPALWPGKTKRKEDATIATTMNVNVRN